MLLDRVNRADVGMVECGGSLGLALEPFQGLPVLESSSGRNFKATVRLSLESWAL